jgi:hypothetical protein
MARRCACAPGGTADADGAKEDTPFSTPTPIRNSSLKELRNSECRIRAAGEAKYQFSAPLGQMRASGQADLLDPRPKIKRFAVELGHPTDL